VSACPAPADWVRCSCLASIDRLSNGPPRFGVGRAHQFFSGVLVPAVRHAAARRRATAGVTATSVCVAVAGLTALLGAGTAGAAQTSGAGTATGQSGALISRVGPRIPGARTAAGPAVVQQGPVGHVGATSGPGAVVGAVVELTPPAGSDAVVAHLAATRGGPSTAARLATLAAVAPPVSAEAAVLAWAARLNLTVTQHDRWAVGVSGPAAAMSAAFATTLVAAKSPFAPTGPAAFLRPVSAPRVPAALAGVARWVSGLDTRPTYAPRSALEAPSTVMPSALSNYGYTGDQLRDAYGVPRDPTAGAGLTVATIQFSGYNSVDFTNYALQAAIPLFAGQLTNVSVDGADPAAISAPGADVEVDLDTQSILAVAPMARQRVYIAPNGSGEIDVYNKVADDVAAGLVQVVSTSWGKCEADLGFGEAAAIQSAVQRMVAAGATMSASSGDSGSFDCSGSASDAVDFPTSIPEVVSVGGTRLVGGYQSAWGNGYGASGGGQSTVFSRPSYQSGLAQPGTKRLVPDIALDADPSTGFAVVRQSTPGTVGGTSLASPLFAGLLAGALSEADRTTGVGDVHAALYSAPADAFQDVVSGSNGSFSAAAGYDEVTGLGAPRFGALAEALGLTPVARASYHPINPTRIADTRTGIGVPLARLGAGQSLTLTVPGSTPQIVDPVTAVVVNVTAINPTVATYLSVFPTGATGSTSVSSVNAVPGTPTPNLVTVKTDPNGRISIFNHAGSIDVAVDLAGYYTRTPSDLYTAVKPSRILDTRSGTGVAAGQVGPGQTITLHLTGSLASADAVTLNVTAVNASAATHVSVFPAGFAGGAASSNLNVAPAHAVANLVITKVSGGAVQFLNAFGNVDLVADVEGYYSTGSGGLTLSPVSPVRILDTRPSGLGPDSAATFVVAAAGSRAQAVLLNLTGVSPTAGTFLSLFPFSVPVAVGRLTSSLNIDANAVRANLTTTTIDAADPLTERVYNRAGTIAVLADVCGYFSGQTNRLPQTSVTESGPTAAAFGASVAFSASATTSGPSVFSLAPGATVTFVEPGVGVLGTVPVASDGSAGFSTSSLSVGTHTVYAVVAAHDGISGSTSTPVTVTVS